MENIFLLLEGFNVDILKIILMLEMIFKFNIFLMESSIKKVKINVC